MPPSKRKNVREDAQPPPIVLVEDDDDEVQITSAITFAQARSIVSRRSGRFTVINEEDLEINAGSRVSEITSGSTRPQALGNRSQEYKTVSNIDPIDLTNSNDECQLIGSPMAKKRKTLPPAEVKEMKLLCAICLDNMKEETSTTCGHVFCKKCITSSIETQKKCPTCRRKLTMSKIHRIYLSGHA